jgi:AraC-like DNA-binding protein
VEVMRGLSNHEHPAAGLLSRAESAMSGVGGRRRRRQRVVKLQVQRRLVPGEIDEMLGAYESGQTILALAERFQVSRTTVMAHLRRAGVETRYNRLDGRLDEATRLYERGWSLARVAQHFNVSAGSVLNAFNRAGVPTRPVGTNQWSTRSRG